MPNQCEGCRLKLRLQGNIHVDSNGYPVQECIKDKFTPNEFLSDMGTVHMDEASRLFH